MVFMTVVVCDQERVHAQQTKRIQVKRKDSPKRVYNSDSMKINQLSGHVYSYLYISTSLISFITFVQFIQKITDNFQVKNKIFNA